MTLLLIAFLGVSLGADPGDGPTNVAATTGVLPLTDSEKNTTLAKEYQKLEAEDDTAQAEVDKWVRENDALKKTGGGLPEAELNERIRKRFEPIHKAYQEFIDRNPRHVQARLAYGNFLNERQDEAGARVQWEKALELDPKSPAAYNNLAGIYSETGQGKKAFEFFTKAIELNPAEGLYYHNFGDSLYVLRKVAMEHYHLSEQEVYAKAIGYYSNAARLDPRSFSFAWDLAQTYYVIRPLPTEAALNAWTNTLKIARDDTERESVYVHFARVKMLDGRLGEARKQIEVVTNPALSELKTRLLRSLEERERVGIPTNATPAAGVK
jgi:tetratricopeptide (TPR) repeat protein